jgi:hypothetical protein
MFSRNSGQKIQKSIGQCGIGRSVGFVFSFLFYMGLVRENFDFQLIGGGEWRQVTSQVRDRCGRIEPVTSQWISARDVRLNFERLEVNE